MKLTAAATVTALAGLLASVTVALAPDAMAATCPSGWVCFWQDANFGGGKYTTQDSAIADFSKLTFHNGVPLNDHISSVYNNTGHKLYLFIDADFDNIGGCGFTNCTDDETVPPHTQRAHVVHNDAYSSELWGN